MSGATRSQKVRLGIFLAVAGTIMGGTLVAMVGVAALEKRDEYPVRFEGSVSGLSPGSPVRFNGLDVGRVERVRIDPKRPSGVEVVVSLIKGTPLRSDTVAVLNLQGITGLKFIELQGGGDSAAAIEPGTEIPSSRSSLDMLTDKASSIALKIESVLDNLSAMTAGENAKSIAAILRNVDGISGSLAKVLDDNRAPVAALVSDARAIVGDVRGAVVDAKGTLAAAQLAMERVSLWVDPGEVRLTIQRLRTAFDRVDVSLGGIDEAVRNVKARLSAGELGKAIGAFTTLSDASTTLVKRLDNTVIRAREDLFLVLDAVIDGAEAFSELANVLRDDPASLIRGKGGDRETPE